MWNIVAKLTPETTVWRFHGNRDMDFVSMTQFIHNHTRKISRDSFWWHCVWFVILSMNECDSGLFMTCRSLHYIYIYAFSRRFYPKRLTLHSSYSFTFDQLLLSLGIEPMILALLAPCSTIWATGKPTDQRSNPSFVVPGNITAAFYALITVQIPTTSQQCYSFCMLN